MEKPTRQERKSLSQFIPLREDDTSNGNIRYGDFCWNPSWIHMGKKLEVDVISINKTLREIGIIAPVFLSPLTTKKDDELPITPTKSGNEATASVTGSLNLRNRKPHRKVYFNEERKMFEFSIDFSSLATEAETHSKNKKGSADDAYAALVNKELAACFKQLVHSNYDKICDQHEPAQIERRVIKILLSTTLLLNLPTMSLDLSTPGRIALLTHFNFIIWNLFDLLWGIFPDSTDPKFEHHMDKWERFKENPSSVIAPHYMTKHLFKPLTMLYSSRQQLVRARSNND